MLKTLAITNYRSIRSLAISLDAINIITGPNGSGKSNLYKALRLLANTASSGVNHALISEGGLSSAFWAGPQKKISYTSTMECSRLKLGFSTDGLGYTISLGKPVSYQSAFDFDPEIKHECIFSGPYYRPVSCSVQRKGPVLQVRNNKGWQTITQYIPNYDTIFDSFSNPMDVAEIFQTREMIRNWRFYDHFRTDAAAPARIPQFATRTTVLSHDGSDVAAAIQTIIEIGDYETLNRIIDHAFPGSKLGVSWNHEGLFSLAFHQRGLLRPLTGIELSDGTLRFILWVAALLTPRPPTLMVLNEPENSIHADVLPALAKLIVYAAQHSQIWVISHSQPLIHMLKKHSGCQLIELEKQDSQTLVKNQGILDSPNWNWPD